MLAQTVPKLLSPSFAFCQANASLTKKLIHLHNALAQLLDFPVIVSGELSDLGLVVCFCFSQVAHQFLDL